MNDVTAAARTLSKASHLSSETQRIQTLLSAQRDQLEKRLLAQREKLKEVLPNQEEEGSESTDAKLSSYRSYVSTSCRNYAVEVEKSRSAVREMLKGIPGLPTSGRMCQIKKIHVHVEEEDNRQETHVHVEEEDKRQETYVHVEEEDKRQETYVHVEEEDKRQETETVEETWDEMLDETSEETETQDETETVEETWDEMLDETSEETETQDETETSSDQAISTSHLEAWEDKKIYRYHAANFRPIDK